MKKKKKKKKTTTTGWSAYQSKLKPDITWKLLRLWREDELFEITFEFKWKHPAYEMSSGIFLFQKYVDKFYMYH